ncbi:MAG TPA: hypothetical protein VNI01_14180 [Elusimicrobiota bacterium]|jgi:hypothetical protein|nr:hypothetical protein [Elusimicrobiota bacterium]
MPRRNLRLTAARRSILAAVLAALGTGTAFAATVASSAQPVASVPAFVLPHIGRQLSGLTGLLDGFGSAGLQGALQESTAREAILRDIGADSPEGAAKLYLLSAAFSPELRERLVQEAAVGRLGPQWDQHAFAEGLSRFAERAAATPEALPALEAELARRRPHLRLLGAADLARTAPGQAFDGGVARGPASEVLGDAPAGAPRHMALLEPAAARLPWMSWCRN